MDGDGETRASEALSPEGELEPSQQEEDGEDVMAGHPQGLFPAGKSQELEHRQEEEERLSREWEDKRWSRMDQLAKELTADKRLRGEDDPDRSMKLSFRARAYGFRDPGPQPRRGWRPSSREDSVEARGDFEEKKEEEGSANRRAEVGISQPHQQPLPHREDTVPLAGAVLRRAWDRATGPGGQWEWPGLEASDLPEGHGMGTWPLPVCKLDMGVMGVGLWMESLAGLAWGLTGHL